MTRVKGVVLVTGAGGCVGYQLVPLLRRRGYRLRLTDRPGSPLPDAAPGVEVIPADLTDFRKIRGLTRGLSAVIHLAAIVDVGLDLKRLRPLNLDAARHLYESARDQGARQFVFFSTGSLYSFKEGFVTEGDPVRPLNDYGWSKLLAEDFFRGQPGRDLPVNIIRPALIFGPRGRVLLNMLAPLPALFRLIGKTYPRIRGGPSTNSVHSYDVAKAAALLLEHPQRHGEIFNVASDDPLTFGEILDVLMREEGLKPGRRTVSYPTSLMEWFQPALSSELLLRPLNRCLTALWGYVQKKQHLQSRLEPKIDAEMVDFLTQGLCFSNQKIKKLGLRLKFAKFVSGWHDTASWMRREKWLP